MIKKNAVLICIVISVILMVTATLFYPGGSIINKNSVGFIWTENFISNLFQPKAINGADNPARVWALIAIAFHSVAYGIFFINMSVKIPTRSAATVLKLIGTINILFTFLIATPFHDIMVTVSSTFFLMGLFYVTVFILKTKLHLLKFCCIICLLTFYYTLFIYGCAKDWVLLAIMQKVCFISSMLLVLGLQYFTKQEDFAHIKPAGKK